MPDGDVAMVCGGIGAADVTRVATMARLAGALTPLVESDNLILFGSPGCTPREDSGGTAYAWTVGGAQHWAASPTHWEDIATGYDACGVVHHPDGSATLHQGISGVQPLYIHIDGDAAYFATDLSWLADSADAKIAPDWDGWAHIISAGAPMNGRTTFAGMTRLGPMGYVRAGHGSPPTTHEAHWPWLDVDPDPTLEPTAITGAVIDALRAQLRRHVAGPHPVQAMLSGGRDSRLLTMLATEMAPADAPITAWTTSSDTGTSMEELVAADVANALGIPHHIIPGRHDQFPADTTAYAKTVGWQASFHTWLMPVAQELAREPGMIIDGLGGGVFLGGGFPDADGAHTSVVSSRFRRLTRYLDAATSVLDPATVSQLTERTRADFDAVSTPIAGHPNGATFTAYLTRTMPGISLAPAKLLGSQRPTVMPIMTDDVITQALRVTHKKKADGAWYPDLLTNANAEVGGRPTAADRTRRRQHVRRGASGLAAEWYRNLIGESPAGILLAPHLKEADVSLWRTLLTKTRQQHLLRGVALLALWLGQYSDRLTSTDPSPLLDNTGTIGAPQ